jgi:hypothetical protein
LLTRLTSYTDVTPDADANGIQQIYRTDIDGNITVTIESTGKITIASAKVSTNNIELVACVLYNEDNNIEIVYMAYTKREGEE